MAIVAHPVSGRLETEASAWRSVVEAPTLPWVADEDDLDTLESQLHAAREVMRPGFMTLRAMRHGERIVDFVWSFVSAAASRILDRSALDLYGNRLRIVLAGEDGCEAVFEQYRRVVQHSAASAIEVLQAHGCYLNTYRHAAVRLGDGVAVTLTNVAAAHRARALELALHAQQVGVARFMVM
jgi:hypothetical protein